MCHVIITARVTVTLRAPANNKAAAVVTTDLVGVH